MRVLIKGAGDLASGIACRLHQCGCSVVMTDLAVPTAVRRTVAFSRAVYERSAEIEGTTAQLCSNIDEMQNVLRRGEIAVMIDPEAKIRAQWKPDAVVDAILAKHNLGTCIDDAPIVIGVGPGFTAGKDCHCVVETKRGHYLGRCIYTGSAIANTGVPGNIGGYTTERILRVTACLNRWPQLEIRLRAEIFAQPSTGCRCAVKLPAWCADCCKAVLSSPRA